MGDAHPLTIPRYVAWQVAWGQAARGGVRWGSVWFVTVRQVWLGMVLCDAVRNGWVRQVRIGTDSSGAIWWGKAGAAWIVVVWFRNVRYGGLRQVGLGWASFGAKWCGEAG